MRGRTRTTDGSDTARNSNPLAFDRAISVGILVENLYYIRTETKWSTFSSKPGFLVDIVRT